MNEKEIKAFLWTQGAGKVVIDQIVKDIRKAKARDAEVAETERFFGEACRELKKAVAGVKLSRD